MKDREKMMPSGAIRENAELPEIIETLGQEIGEDVYFLMRKKCLPEYELSDYETAVKHMASDTGVFRLMGKISILEACAKPVYRDAPWFQVLSGLFSNQLMAWAVMEVFARHLEYGESLKTAEPSDLLYRALAKPFDGKAECGVRSYVTDRSTVESVLEEAVGIAIRAESESANEPSCGVGFTAAYSEGAKEGLAVILNGFASEKMRPESGTACGDRWLGMLLPDRNRKNSTPEKGEKR